LTSKTKGYDGKTH